jgi:hypothetical protein
MTKSFYYEVQNQTDTSEHQERIDDFLNFTYDKIFFIILVLIVLYWKKLAAPKIIKQVNHVLLHQFDAEYKELIKVQLIKICQIANADRIVLAEFHNGEMYLSGRHRIKLSITAEYKEGGIASLYDYIQSVPIEKINNDIKVLLEKGESYYHIADVEDINCKSYLDSLNISEKKDFLLYQKKENEDVICFGILSIQYINKPLYHVYATNSEKIKDIVLQKENLERIVSRAVYKNTYSKRKRFIDKIFDTIT